MQLKTSKHVLLYIGLFKPFLEFSQRSLNLFLWQYKSKTQAFWIQLQANPKACKVVDCTTSGVCFFPTTKIKKLRSSKIFHSIWHRNYIGFFGDQKSIFKNRNFWREMKRIYKSTGTYEFEPFKKHIFWGSSVLTKEWTTNVQSHAFELKKKLFLSLIQGKKKQNNLFSHQRAKGNETT